MYNPPKTLNEALDQLPESVETRTEERRWQLLAFILRQFMLAQGVDLDRKIE